MRKTKNAVICKNLLTWGRNKIISEKVPLVFPWSVINRKEIKGPYSKHLNMKTSTFQINCMKLCVGTVQNSELIYTLSFRWTRDTRCLVGRNQTRNKIPCQGIGLSCCSGLQWINQHLVNHDDDLIFKMPQKTYFIITGLKVNCFSIVVGTVYYISTLQSFKWDYEISVLDVFYICLDLGFKFFLKNVTIFFF